MYETVNLVVAWNQFKENPHIEFNSNTGMYRCKTCNMSLNKNSGGAGKHSTKIHGLFLSGKKAEKKLTSIMDFSNKDIFDGIVHISKKIDETLEKTSSYFESLKSENQELHKQNYFLLSKLETMEMVQDNISKKLEELSIKNNNIYAILYNKEMIKFFKAQGWL